MLSKTLLPPCLLLLLLLPSLLIAQNKSIPKIDSGYDSVIVETVYDTVYIEDDTIRLAQSLLAHGLQASCLSFFEGARMKEPRYSLAGFSILGEFAGQQWFAQGGISLYYINASEILDEAYKSSATVDVEILSGRYINENNDEIKIYDTVPKDTTIDAIKQVGLSHSVYILSIPLYLGIRASWRRWEAAAKIGLLAHIPIKSQREATDENSGFLRDSPQIWFCPAIGGDLRFRLSSRLSLLAGVTAHFVQAGQPMLSQASAGIRTCLQAGIAYKIGRIRGIL